MNPELENTCIVIFGASGDLTGRKLMPAFYNLFANGLMPVRFTILGVSRSPLDDLAFRDRILAALSSLGAHEPAKLDAFCGTFGINR